MSTRASSPLLHLDLRLHSLESQIIGPPTPFGSAPTPQTGESSKSVTRRIQEIQDELDRCLSGNEPLRRLVAGYDTYLPLLTLPTFESGASSSNSGDGSNSAIHPADLLPDATKLTMVLEAGDDIIQAERSLREIDTLRLKGVEGSGNLESVLEVRGQVAELGKDAKKRSSDLDQARREVGLLLSRYNEFTSTASDMFLDLHHRIEDLEEGVARLERAKRKEMAGRF